MLLEEIEKHPLLRSSNLINEVVESIKEKKKEHDKCSDEKRKIKLTNEVKEMIRAVESLWKEMKEIYVRT